ncbi:MAG: hypothetical protein M3Y57_02285 [Acidobacteriota bacterium]|nr:hypothetical protein [Acidobacteriota bacterium]
MNDHETRIKALEEARKELEDAFLVMTHLETKQGSVIKQQAQAIDDLRRQAEDQRQLNRDTDKRIADLVSAIGTFISRQ